MGNRTAQRSAESKPEHVPLDVPTMRDTAARLLAEEAELPSLEEVETLTLLLRGMIMVAIPEIETAAGKLPEDAVPRACALACVGEARMRLRLEPSNGTLPACVAHAQRLARSVRALADHYVTLGEQS
ncbi:DUF6415 family natural product biosynthesis protein [Streptomyces scabiei]|uniref:DUF6415 family natural product biosynthesis protein n=1 Tax=Streptomyces scabiei TaxID=1930 RepID=UPI0029AD37E5|nr:DUF6415 family natural product biosynthesis protein [Streptomyces scabiei]MDX3252491.1 DUF6415 family natural product biosynthesis protein [Streptomyces scabiei]